MKKLRERLTPACVFIFCVFCLSVLLGYFCVWTHDDYTTNMGGVGAAFQESLFFGNGRYLGNFLVNLILPYKIFDAAVRGVCITALVGLIAVLAAKWDIKSVSLSLLLFVGSGNLVFREAVIWGHGFYNFFPPVVLILTSVCLLRKLYLRPLEKYKSLGYILLAVLGFCQQLFSENSTCIALVVAVLVMAAVIRKKQKKPPALIWLIASVLGAIVMFVLPEIMRVSEKMEEYRGRGVGADSLRGWVRLVIDNFYVVCNVLVPLFFVWGLLSYALIRVVSRADKGCFVYRFRLFFYTVFALFPVASVIYPFLTREKWETRTVLKYQQISEMAQTMVHEIFLYYYLFFCVYLICVVSVLFLNKNRLAGKKVYAVILFVFALSVCELLIITVMGPRCLLLTVAILYLFLVRYLSDEQLLSRKLSVAAGMVGIAIFVYIISIMNSVWKVNNARMAYAEAQLSQGKTTIEIIRLPHKSWLHLPDETYAYSWYFNNGVSREEMSYTYIEYEEYLKQQKEQIGIDK